MTSPHDGEFADYIAARLEALRRLAFLLCQHWHHADNLAQAAAIKADTHWARAARADNTDAYVNAILVREFLHERRSAWARLVSLTEAPETAARQADHDSSLDLRSAVVALPPRQRAVLVLRFYCALRLLIDGPHNAGGEWAVRVYARSMSHVMNAGRQFGCVGMPDSPFAISGPGPVIDGHGSQWLKDGAATAVRIARGAEFGQHIPFRFAARFTTLPRGWGSSGCSSIATGCRLVPTWRGAIRSPGCGRSARLRRTTWATTPSPANPSLPHDLAGRPGYHGLPVYRATAGKVHATDDPRITVHTR